MKTCVIEGCERRHKARGWCDLHYNRWQRLGDPRAHLAPYESPRPKVCTVKGCEAETRTGSLCGFHYSRWRQHGDPEAGGRRRRGRRTPALPCSVDGCTANAICRGWCGKHYAKWTKYGDPLGRHQPQTGCLVDGCDRKHFGVGYCKLHWRRWKRHGDPLFHHFERLAAERTRLDWRSLEDVAKIPWSTHDQSGYVRGVWPEHPNAKNSSQIAEHTAVMAAVLGRPLRDGETVHHINGVRYDNRPENLELWLTSHRSGQRVTDLIADAHALLERYRDDLQLWPENLRV